MNHVEQSEQNWPLLEIALLIKSCQSGRLSAVDSRTPYVPVGQNPGTLENEQIAL